MLSKEQASFIGILSDFIHKQNTEIRADMLNVKALEEIAKQQECGGILYYQTRLPELQVSYASCSYYAFNQRKLLAQIKESFGDNHIRFLIIKGIEVADIYPVAALRSMGDLDILVHEEDKEQAHKILLSLGMTNERMGGYEWVYQKNGIEVELHHCLMYDELYLLPNHKDYFDDVWNCATTEDGTQYHLDWNYHLAYLFLHLRKHFLCHGVGFRQFMDIAVVSNTCDINWDDFEKTTVALHIHDFVSVCYSFIKKWFNVDVPMQINDSVDHYFEDSTQIIFENGVFGLSENNANNYTIQKIVNSKSYRGEKIRIRLQYYFPPYKKMTMLPKFSFLRNKPWLLPVAWIYRFGYSLIHGTARESMNKVNGYCSVTKEQIAHRTSYLKQWGL